jgi:hypothetical protein
MHYTTTDVQQRLHRLGLVSAVPAGLVAGEH